jgi:hypothetical protein
MAHLISKDFVLLTIFILFTAGGSTLVESDILLVFVFISLFVTFLYRKLNFGKGIFKIIIFWGVINILSVGFINKGQNISILTFVASIIKISMPYFLVKLIGINFFDKLIKYVYYLTLISLPIFVLQLVMPSLFYSLSGYLNFMTGEAHKMYGNWYVFIYMFTTFHLTQNAGFMWEPGAFAAVLIFGIVYRISTNGFIIDKYIIVFFIALLTTVSTAGYLAIAFIILAFLLKKGKSNYAILFMIPVAFYFAYNFYNESEFLSGKIDKYLELGADTREGTLRVSRLGIAIITLESSLHWPFGNGVIDSSYILQNYGEVEGPNSLATILHQWGWIGLAYITYILYKFIRLLPTSNYSIFLLIAFLIVLFSNPFGFRYLVYSIPYYMFSYSRNLKYKQSLF